MKKKKVILFVIVCLAAVLGFTFKDYFQNEYTNRPIKGIGTIPEKSRLLVVAPHCDDETLSSAGLIRQVLDRKGEVQVVIITNGDGSRRSVEMNEGILHPSARDFIQMGYTRQQESLTALNSLGVHQEDIFFLGYPDGGMTALWSDHWNVNNPFKNYHTQTSYSPYVNSYRLDAVFAGEDVAQDIMEIIERFKPNIISYPHPNDYHPDHWAAHAFVKYALDRIDFNPPRELLYLIHRDEWPAPLGNHPKAELKPPRTLLQTGTDWRKLPLNNREQSLKRSAIQSYKTQTLSLRALLMSFDRRDELYGEYSVVYLPFNNAISLSPQLLCKNPAEDSLGKGIGSSGVIKAILISKETNSLLLKMQTRKRTSTKYAYELDVTVFRTNQEPARLSIVYHNVKTTIRAFSQNRSEERIECCSKEEPYSISFRISSSSIEGIDSMLISGKSILGGKVMDRTAWRMVKFY